MFLQLLWETKPPGRGDPSVLSSTPCQNTPHQTMRAKNFSRKYFNRLPYCRLRKRTAESPAITHFLLKQRNPRPLLRGERSGPQDGDAAGHSGSCSSAAGPPGQGGGPVPRGRGTRFSPRRVFGAGGGSFPIPFCAAVCLQAALCRAFATTVSVTFVLPACMLVLGTQLYQ